MNPEFRRQLTLELTPSRLILMPAILLLLVVCVFVLDQRDPLVTLHQGAFTILGLLGAAVGTFTALSSINDEVNDRTWDQQRMSAMGAWPMAWGKLLGGPSYAWWGVLWCAATALVTGTLLGKLPSTITTLALALLGIAALHCAVMASRLFGMDPAKPASARQSWALVVVLLLLLQLGSLVTAGVSEFFGPQGAGRWWGLRIHSANLGLLLVGSALLLGLLALWRAMAMQLSVPTTPWAWVLGNASLCVVLVGLIPDAHWRVLAAILLLMLATYYIATIESQVAQRWRAVLYSAQRGQWRRLWVNMPLWPISWCMGLAVLLPAYAVWSADPLSHRNALGPFMLMVLLHVLRDCGVYLFFSLRRSSRSPLGMTLLVLFIIGGILPAMFWSTGLAPLFEPLFGVLEGFTTSQITAPALGGLAWTGMLLQLLIVAGALVWRFQQIAPSATNSNWPLPAGD